jgi:hypothetical protein
VATLRASPGRRISPINGADRADIARFAKRLMNLPKTVPAVQDFFIWTPKLSGKHVFNPSFCKKALDLNKNRARGPGIFTYESLKFWKIMFAAHNFLKRHSNFVKIHLQTPLIMKSYTSLPKLLGKIFTFCTPKVPEKYVCSPWFSGKGPRASQQSTLKPRCLQNFRC